MLSQKIKRDDKTIYKIDFDSLYEIVDYISSGKTNSRVFGECSSQSEDFDFTGTRSMEEALEKCLYGDIENYDVFLSLKEKLDSCFPKTSNKRKAVESYYGFRPNITKALTGNPKSMFKLEKAKENKFINMHYNVAVAWTHSKESIRNKGIITMSIIRFLESIGYRINLNFYELSSCGDEIIQFSTTIKKHGQPLEPSICYFPMCHASFLRRILFRVLEVTDVRNSWSSGYGRPVDPSETKSLLELAPNDLVIGQPSDMGVGGDNINQDTVNYLKYMNLDRYLKNDETLQYDEESKGFVYVKRKND